MKTILSKTIVFLTGAFVSHTGWKNWKNFFESQGYTCIVEPWPEKSGTPQYLRAKQPHDTALAGLHYADVLDHYTNIIKGLPEKPILIGHSLGGLTAQILLQRGLGQAAIAVHSVPPQGVTSFEFSFIRSLWKPLGLFSSLRKTHLMSFSEWQYAFTNGMSLQEQKESYEENTIPESRRVLRDPLGKIGHIDFSTAHAPLLFISGSADHIMPASLNYKNYMRYKKGNPHSVTEYKEFEGRNHYVLGLPTWREEASYALEFINKY
ncbi:alpha/beta hydrolase [Flavobacterium sp. MAH-1]|uniref:Alpha/beta hydrolase n=1 Tax=Flavobacterium agri TaxID=2743471 RepID=A0A7Y8Y644_9FLAO|nr:alpha/beta hydrolase [Flavobacterium agri]NUY81966.1 alpha/beta hydrolase [Flavobacterium agri]NYA71990.1 alpha/beta hydrolase [Flavobacterium agri]